MKKEITVIADGEEWPEVWAINPSTGFREPKDKPLNEMVARARVEWLHQHVDPPTILRVGMQRRRKFIMMFAAAHSAPMLDDSISFMGMRVEWCEGDGIAIACS